jgi:hypothetical protein
MSAGRREQDAPGGVVARACEPPPPDWGGSMGPFRPLDVPLVPSVFAVIDEASAGPTADSDLALLQRFLRFDRSP